MSTFVYLLAAIVAFLPTIAHAENWVTSWTCRTGPYPSGNPSAQPVLSFVFPVPDAGAHDQSFRLIVRPDLWGPSARLRFSNAFGAQPVTFDHVAVGRQLSGAELVAHSLRPVTFAGSHAITVPPASRFGATPRTSSVRKASSRSAFTLPGTAGP